MNKKEEKTNDELGMFYNICDIHEKYNNAKLPDRVRVDIWEWITEHDKREKERLIEEIENKVIDFKFNFSDGIGGEYSDGVYSGIDNVLKIIENNL